MIHRKVVFGIDDPTNHLDDEGRDWSHTGGDPRVFLETKKVWEKRIGEHTNVAIVLVRTSNVTSFVWEDDSHLIVPASPETDMESSMFYYNSFVKAISQRYSYDYYISTTLGVFWDFDRLLAHLGEIEPRQVYMGRIWAHFPIWFISGSGIIISRDVAEMVIHAGDIKEYLIRNPKPIGFGDYVYKYNDVMFGAFMAQKGIRPRAERWWCDFDFNTLDNLDAIIAHADSLGMIQYRVKNSVDRITLDPIMLNRLCDFKKKTP
jgi:hypothetical protein